MNGTNPKVSFIPKGSLVREESFLERRRPQSAIGVIAGFAFVLAVGSYAGLFYYNNLLNIVVAEKTTEIKTAQKEFSDAPEVGEARVFRARADLARELLNAHTVVSPVFGFLTENTAESIMYDKLSFKNGPDGATLELSGEAQNYASLAFQSDVFRSKTNELSKFSVTNITLTKFGTVTFSLTMVFKPDFLLYTKNAGDQGRAEDKTSVPIINVPVSDVQATATSSFSEITNPQGVLGETSPITPAGTDGLSNSWAVAPLDGVATTTASGATNTPSVLLKLWLKFKFW